MPTGPMITKTRSVEARIHHRSDALFSHKIPGTGSRLCYMGHVLMEDSDGLAVDAKTTRCHDTPQLAALEMIEDIVDPGGGQADYRRRGQGLCEQGLRCARFCSRTVQTPGHPNVAQHQSGRYLTD